MTINLSYGTNIWTGKKVTTDDLETVDSINRKAKLYKILTKVSGKNESDGGVDGSILSISSSISLSTSGSISLSSMLMFLYVLGTIVASVAVAVAACSTYE